MNDHQLAIGESTFGGRDQLVSQKGLIDCDNLTRLMLERAKTAREAIRIGGGLIEQYGWCDVGEALTIADTKEVWLMEIVGPGKGAVGAAWAAQRIPDDHVSVVANGSRIGEIDLKNPDFFMALEERFQDCRAAWLLGPEGRPAVPLLRGLQPQQPLRGQRYAAGMAGAGPVGPLAAAAPQPQSLPAVGQAGEAGGAGKDHGAVPRHV